ncbi:hypothetical protein [Paenibacillus polymyxa]|uniref:hypothetical protein n=1 Tax=Paenibacillus polymyxa TaxID=1406 RepID=UPI001F3B5C91|nr:hypothetical protein [Paenibacillus polymyxa]
MLHYKTQLPVTKVVVIGSGNQLRQMRYRFASSVWHNKTKLTESSKEVDNGIGSGFKITAFNKNNFQQREKMNHLNRWFRNLLVQRLITLIEFEEHEGFKQLYNSSLDRIVSQLTKER